MELGDIAEVVLERLEEKIEEGEARELVRVLLNASDAVDREVALVNDLCVVVVEAEGRVLVSGHALADDFALHLLPVLSRGAIPVVLGEAGLTVPVADEEEPDHEVAIE